MKAMLFVSIHTMFDAAPFERKALELTLARLSAPIPWSLKDHERLLGKASVLQALAAMPCFASARRATETYLDILNELLWEAPAVPKSETRKAIALATVRGLRRGLISDYPLLTTNLARATALETTASSIGDVCALSDPHKPTMANVGLLHLANQLNVRPADCIAVVANARDRRAANAAGMTPFVIRNPGNWHGSTSVHHTPQRLNPADDLATLIETPSQPAHLAA